MSQFVAVRSLNRSTQVRVVKAFNEVQRVTVNATAGQFKLTFSGQQTVDLAFNITATALQTALEALSNIDPGDVYVTGGPGNSGGTTPYFVSFAGQYSSSDVPQMTGANGTTPLSGGGASVTVATTTSGTAGNVQVKLSPTVDTIVDLDITANRRALAQHSAIGQYIVTAANASIHGVALPPNE